MTGVAEAEVAEIAKGLGVAQRKAMRADGETAYCMRVGLNTLWALRARGLRSVVSGLGSMAFPHTSTRFPLTPLGLAVRAHLLAQEAGDA